MNIPEIYLWADDKSGLGHKMRCLALGEEWTKRGGVVHTGGTPDKNSVVVFDGYEWENRALKMWGEGRNLVVRIDDRDLSGLTEILLCDVFINPNYGAYEEHLPPLPKHCRALIGPEYFMLRDDILNARVSSGGGFIDADVRDIDVSKFAQILASADSVICSASTKAHEALFFGKPIILRQTADNQAIPYNAMILEDYAVPDGSGLEPSPNVGQKAIDGRGRERVVDAIFEEWVEWIDEYVK